VIGTDRFTPPRVMRDSSASGTVPLVTTTRQSFLITVAGEMDEQLRDEFDDAEITVDHSATRLRVTCLDASMLHGFLHRLDAFGLELLDVHQTDDTST
jgi:hypothetical protein